MGMGEAGIQQLYEEKRAELGSLRDELERVQLRVEQLTDLVAALERMDEIHGGDSRADGDHVLDLTDDRPNLATVEMDAPTISHRDGDQERDRAAEPGNDSDGPDDTSTREAILDVLREAGHPMAPRQVLQEMRARNTDPKHSADAQRLVGAHLMRMRDDEDTPVTRVDRGLYAYVDDPSAEMDVEVVHVGDHVRRIR